ncbi:hypothetical protein A4H97_19380 [Niastella yeongjuensis]|uniref:RNA polymerase sigma-70 factor n=1 Tax=Niastella yeongjuensis TaxID=354355 RepID=A0A1V9DYE4_9BACT|nr:RNA polymerase sigma-70 factor [Niastella yeongjuensis]OQP38872.1 hypothetical protein A4H97_19380 [Niastella yeongjuensis]SEO29555.1 RNA polymerase sigma-70 factor, ECF subfamily [Niastella yeongjuensis]
MIDIQEVKALQQQLSLTEDETAYVRLFRIYYTALFQFSLSFVKNKPAAEEIVSDVFMQLWQIRKKLDTISNLTVYLYTCIRNHSLNYLRKNKRESTSSLDDASLSIPSTTADPEQLYITTELAKKIDAIIEQLPEKCRIIFKLVREDGLKYREVAEVLDISVKTVETQMGIAMKKINLAIQPLTDPELLSATRLRCHQN